MFSVDNLIGLHQALVEENRLSKELKTEATRLDNELEDRYFKLVETSLKTGRLAQCLRKKQVFSLVYDA